MITVSINKYVIHKFLIVVVIWCDLLGGIQCWQDPLPRVTSSLHSWNAGKRRETAQTKQCCMLWTHESHEKSWELSLLWWGVAITITVIGWLHNVYMYTRRYSLMHSCWEALPENRPSFSVLVSNLSSILMPLADYLNVGTFRQESFEGLTEGPNGEVFENNNVHSIFALPNSI